MDRLQAMTTFLTVVDTGGFASAARKLKVSPSVVTRMVGELEDAMGVRLLTRTTRTVRVTDTGADYADRCRRILADIEEAEQSATSMHGTTRGLLSITSSMLFGKYYVTPIVTDYLGRYPEVDVSCWFLDRIVNIVDEGIDVAIRLGDLPDSSMQAVRVGQVRRVVCASPDYLAQHGVPRHPEDLAGRAIVSARSRCSYRVPRDSCCSAPSSSRCWPTRTSIVRWMPSRWRNTCDTCMSRRRRASSGLR